MSALANGSFWLDGGYDREAVEACPYHPLHKWWTFRLGDVLQPGTMRDPEEMMVICSACYVPRCGTTESPDPCMLPRHHTEPHSFLSGHHVPVGGAS
jgi:hypothetical protein